MNGFEERIRYVSSWVHGQRCGPCGIQQAEILVIVDIKIVKGDRSVGEHQDNGETLREPFKDWRARLDQ